MTSTMDNIKIGDYFTRIPKCEADGSNYTIYKARMEYAADSASIRDHLDGTAIAPFPVTVPGIGATQAELTSFAQYERELTLFRARQGVLKQAIASTIPDDLFFARSERRRRRRHVEASSRGIRAQIQDGRS